MHSSALGAADLIILRSFSSAARFSLLKDARYSLMLCGGLVFMTSTMFPFRQRGIPAALGERAGVCTLDLKYFVSLFVDANLHTRAPVTMGAVGAHPLSRGEIGPVAVGLMTALHRDHPFAETIVQPGVRRRRITKPSAPRFEIRRPGFVRQFRMCVGKGHRDEE